MLFNQSRLLPFIMCVYNALRLPDCPWLNSV